MSDSRRRSPDVESRRNAATCLALTGMLILAAGLVGLATMVLPRFFTAFVVIMMGFGGFTLLHYLTWGRWLSRPRPGDNFDDADEDRRFPDRPADGFDDVD